MIFNTSKNFTRNLYENLHFLMNFNKDINRWENRKAPENRRVSKISYLFFILINLQKIIAARVLQNVATIAGAMIAVGSSLPYWVR